MKKIIGISFIIAGLLLCLNSLIFKRSKVILEENKIEYTMSNITNYHYVEKEIYTSILSIPQINLKKGIYDVDDYRNNIDNNIMIDKNSIYPSYNNSNVILVAHSGVGEKAYFKRLNELNKDSLVEYYYDHTKYIYKIDNYYYVKKSGKVEIKYNHNKKTITLITCSDSTNQVVYIGYLIDEVNY